MTCSEPKLVLAVLESVTAILNAGEFFNTDAFLSKFLVYFRIYLFHFSRKQAFLTNLMSCNITRILRFSKNLGNYLRTGSENVGLRMRKALKSHSMPKQFRPLKLQHLQYNNQWRSSSPHQPETSHFQCRNIRLLFVCYLFYLLAKKQQFRQKSVLVSFRLFTRRRFCFFWHVPSLSGAFTVFCCFMFLNLSTRTGIISLIGFFSSNFFFRYFKFC